MIVMQTSEKKVKQTQCNEFFTVTFLGWIFVEFEISNASSGFGGAVKTFVLSHT